VTEDRTIVALAERFAEAVASGEYDRAEGWAEAAFRVLVAIAEEE
jgi:hypothetical protein